MLFTQVSWINIAAMRAYSANSVRSRSSSSLSPIDSKSINANICLNYYQNESFIHGDSINNCQNNLIQTKKYNSLMKAHISVEWIASRKANEIIYKFINHNFPIP